MNKQLVRLRTDDPADELCHGWCEATGEWRWFSNRDIAGAVTTGSRPMPDVGRGDDPENYWWVITPTGTRIAFQSIDVEEAT